MNYSVQYSRYQTYSDGSAISNYELENTSYAFYPNPTTGQLQVTSG